MSSSRSGSIPPAYGSTSIMNTETSKCSLNFNARTAKQPLYRPAALRRNGSTTSADILLVHSPSPPLSPAMSCDTKGSWLAGLASAAAPWSPISINALGDLRPESVKLDDRLVRGLLLPKAAWKPDEEAVTCADEDCTVQFGLIDRKHHCRRCGYIFCAAHSSRTTLLWPSSNDVSRPPTPKATPRSTPLSSMLDIPSMLFSSSPDASEVSIHSSASTSSSSSHSHIAHAHSTPATPVGTPPRALPGSVTPVAARVCDGCYFSTPVSDPLTPPLQYASTRPLSVRGSSQHRSPFASPARSPPSHNEFRRAKSQSRSRQSSASSASGGSGGAALSPTTSMESTLGGAYYNASSSATSSANTSVSASASRSRNISPAASLRASAANKAVTLLREVTDEEDIDEDGELRSDRDNVARSPEVSQEFAWQNWATF